MSESQDHRMTAILLRLELLSHGGTQAWNPSGGQSGEPDDKMVGIVVGRPDFPHLAWRRRYDEQGDDVGRERIITEAEKELKAWTGQGERPKIEGASLVDLILEDGEGWEPKVVAQRYGVDEAFVRRKRMAAGRGTEDGKELLPNADPVDRTEKARELRRRGMSTRMIAETLGVSQSAVMKWIRQSAA